jgi:FtsZ-interacting cell division protein YlmF
VCYPRHFEKFKKNVDILQSNNIDIFNLKFEKRKSGTLAGE